MAAGDDKIWAATTGGPLIAVAASALEHWSGIEVPQGRKVQASFRWAGPGSPATDYDRACDVVDFVGVIGVAHTAALVLGDAPHATAWWPEAGGVGTFVRLVHFDGEAETLGEAVEAVLAEAADELEWERGPSFEPAESHYVLFDSSMPGPDAEAADGLTGRTVDGGIALDLPTEPLVVETAHCFRDEIGLTLHRLRRQ